jgi:hypothetical protein
MGGSIGNISVVRQAKLSGVGKFAWRGWRPGEYHFLLAFFVPAQYHFLYEGLCMKIRGASTEATGQTAPPSTDPDDAMADVIMGGYQTLAASTIHLARVREAKAELARRIKSLSDMIDASRSLSAEIRRRRGRDG